MEYHYSDPWLLIRNCVLEHLEFPPEVRIAKVSDRKLSTVMKRVVDRVRFPNDEAVSKLLIRSFTKIPGRASPSYPPGGTPGAAAALSARSAYGENA